MQRNWNSPHHLHRCPQHRHLLLHCCLCPFGLDYYCRGSCHSGHPHRLGRSHTAWGCTQMDSCPVSKERGRWRRREKKNQEWYLGAVHPICHPSLNGSFHWGGSDVVWKGALFLGLVPVLMLGLANTQCCSFRGVPLCWNLRFWHWLAETFAFLLSTPLPHPPTPQSPAAYLVNSMNSES